MTTEKIQPPKSPFVKGDLRAGLTLDMRFLLPVSCFFKLDNMLHH